MKSFFILFSIFVLSIAPWASAEEATDDLQQIKAEIDGHWFLRDDQAQCQKAISLLNKALTDRPDWEEGWAWLSWAYYWEGNNYPEKNKERVVSYQAGMEAGQKAIALNENSVGGNFWYIVNKSTYGRERGIVRSAVYLPEILKITEKVEKLDGSYFYGGVYRLYGRIIYSSPEFLRKAKGYTIEDAVKEMKKALAVNEKFSLTRLYLADIYIEMKKKDEALAELNYVVDMPEDSIDGMNAEVRRDKKAAAERLKEHFTK